MAIALHWIIAITAIIAPTLHLLSDVLEWASGGFSQIQLLINYAGFLPMPFLMLGLYAYQRPRIGWVGLIGAVLYGVAFIYFAHTTLIALEESIPNYEMLWGKLGGVYTFHGGLMVWGCDVWHRFATSHGSVAGRYSSLHSWNYFQLWRCAFATARYPANPGEFGEKSGADCNGGINSAKICCVTTN